jgi:hypothetical protein
MVTGASHGRDAFLRRALIGRCGASTSAVRASTSAVRAPPTRCEHRDEQRSRETLERAEHPDHRTIVEPGHLSQARAANGVAPDGDRPQPHLALPHVRVEVRLTLTNPRTCLDPRGTVSAAAMLTPNMQRLIAVLVAAAGCFFVVAGVRGWLRTEGLSSRAVVTRASARLPRAWRRREPRDARAPRRRHRDRSRL